MRNTGKTHVHGVARRLTRMTVLGVAGLFIGACSSLLDVDNPNNVTPGALDNPVAASSLVNGAINGTANALSSMLNAYNIISDESWQSGSRDDSTG